MKRQGSNGGTVNASVRINLTYSDTLRRLAGVIERYYGSFTAVFVNLCETAAR